MHSLLVVLLAVFAGARFEAAGPTLIGTAGAASAASTSGAAVTGETLVDASLLAEPSTFVPGTPFRVALRLVPQEGWHTYWKNPGDSGLATKLDWTLPPGFTAGSIQWPFPERYTAEPLVDYVYHGETLHLVDITPPATAVPGTTYELRALAKWLVCREMCLPGKQELSLRLRAAATPAMPGLHAARFTAALEKLPQRHPDWKVTAERRGDEVLLALDGAAAPRGTLHFFPWHKGHVANGGAQPVEAVGNRRTLRLQVDTVRNEPFTKLEGIVVASGGWKAERPEALWVEPAVTRGTAAPAPPTGGGAPLWQMVIFAFLGGMLLNLMPCVFPVLSIKVLGFVEQANHSARESKRHGAVFVAGVMASFWSLAGVLLILRAAGRQLGWGFQLQSPLFIVALALLFFLMALQLIGVFEFGSRLTGLGSSLASRSGYRGSFFGGVLATIVATPCTAPFMGSAVGFALAQPWYAAVVVFTALGLGMALPYYVLAASPRLLRLLPRPGRWMESLKGILAFPLFSTVIWLLWVLGRQLGIDAATVALVSLLLATFGLWVQQRWQNAGPGVPKILARVTTVASIVTALALGYQGARLPAMSAVAAATDGIQWIPYDRVKIDELRRQGRPVFVDFTASWCLTCQVNEQVVFSSAEVRDRFRALNVATMKADWSNGDDKITQALAEFGRSGVPFYLLYGKDPAKAADPLPEILTPGIVLDALKKIE